jgi:hypothetical protein
MAKELNITPVLDKIQSYKRRNWIQHVNGMPRNGLHGIIKKIHTKKKKKAGKTT